MTFRLTLCFVLTAALAVAQLSEQPAPDERLQAAIHTEIVVGDLKAALDQYQKLLAQSGGNRAVSARALMGIADCQMKLGQTTEAKATYTAVVNAYADQPEIASQSGAKLAALSSSDPGPRNLNFQQPGGDPGMAAGWFVPKVLKDNGNSAEIRHQGCRDSASCAVIIASATPKQGMFGNLMQSFSAVPYRGKTVRLRANLKLDLIAPGDSAQMWFRVDRPNRAMGAFDNMQDRPVHSPNWTAAEIVGKVADDATNISFGVMSIGSGRAWVDDLSFEVVPAGTESTGMPNPGTKLGPTNLSFEKGTVNEIPSGWSGTQTPGFSAELRREGCRAASPCAVVSSSTEPPSQNFGNLMQAFNATAYRGKTVRLSGWLRMEQTAPKDSAQMWFRVDRPDRQVGAFDNMQDRPVRTAAWTKVEIVGKVAEDAEAINFGVMSIGKGKAWVEDLSFEVVPDKTETTTLMGSAPKNLDFRKGNVGEVPFSWSGGYKGYSMELRDTGCEAGVTYCAVILAPEEPEAKSFGSMVQGISAEAYRGKTVRFRARIRVEAVSKEDRGQLWLRVDLPNKKMGFFDNMDNRPVRSGDWTDAEIVGKIDPTAESVQFGVMSLAKGKVWVDKVSLEVVADGTPETSRK